MKYSEKWKPVNEAGEFNDSDFDKNHPINRSYQFETFLYKVRIRFVRYDAYPENTVKIYVVKTFKSPLWTYIFGYMKTYDEILSLESVEKKYGLKIETKTIEQKAVENIPYSEPVEQKAAENVAEKKAKETVSGLMKSYKEDIKFDDSTGIVTLEQPAIKAEESPIKKEVKKTIKKKPAVVPELVKEKPKIKPKTPKKIVKTPTDKKKNKKKK